jgi:phage terminase large subunit GpA-like protein
MRVSLVGIDTGWCSTHAFTYIDSHSSGKVIGLKGEGDEKLRKMGIDTAHFKKALERDGLYLLRSNQIKDEVADLMKFKWNKDYNQPAGFMNYPQQGDGKYHPKKYFNQYEAEHRIAELNNDGTAVGWKWEKKTSSSQNHFFDVRCYNIALRYIYVKRFFERMPKLKNGTWQDYCAIVKD